jgi:hypothetical protein
MDMSSTSLTRRRFELFCYLLNGSIFPIDGSPAVSPEDGDIEEKPPAPFTLGAGVKDTNDDDDTPQTQVAQ